MIARRAECVFLMLAGLIYLASGLPFLLNPDGASELLGFQLLGVDALSELRGSYGGINVLLGLFVCASVWRGAWRPYALTLLLVVCSGYVLGRTVSFVCDGIPSGMVLSFFALEGVFAVLAALGLRRRQDARD